MNSFEIHGKLPSLNEVINENHTNRYVGASQKFILDDLVKCGILKNDSRKYVTQIYHEIVDGNENMVIVNLETIKNKEELKNETPPHT